MTLEVIDPGPLTSVQTALGRRGYQHLGVPVGGAADAWSARLANRLVGNADDAPVLEATFTGPTLRLEARTAVAVTGGRWRVTIDELPLPPNSSRQVRPGSVMRVESGPGARSYVAIRGMAVEPVLGSASTDLPTGFGGHDGRALRPGDRLVVTEVPPAPPLRWTGGLPSGGAIRMLPGPHAAQFPPDVLTAVEWRVSEAADRAGLRLDRAEILPSAGEVASMGLPLGAVQVPRDGRPIVMLADRPVTGGYPVPACVVAADIGRVAQLRPGDPVRFRWTTDDEAVEALRASEQALGNLEAFSLAAEDETGWAGALD